MTISNADNEQKTKDTIRILLVDDDPSILSLLALFISSFGYESENAVDGIKALELLQARPFDIVITDVMMPNMDGMELLANIQRSHPETDVIVVTGYADTTSYTDVIRSGASDFISKPFNRDELEAKLNRLIRERHTIHELERLSSLDSLTDLYNRRHFDIKLWEEAHRAYRQEYPLFLVMVDVGHFKDYNDTHGHQAGDNLLQSIGQIIMRSTRENVDINYRYGGDEFAIIIPQITMEQAVQVLKRTLEAFHAMQFGMTDLSMGIARFVRHLSKSWEEDVQDLVSRADQALYKAKVDPEHRILQDSE